MMNPFYICSYACVAISTMVFGELSIAETPTLKNSIGMPLVRVSAGEFEMGMLNEDEVKIHHKSSAYQREIHDYVEKPAFPVRLSKKYDIGATEVTVGQFREFVESTGYKTDAERAGEAWLFHPNAEDHLDRFQLKQNGNWRNPGFKQTDTHPVTCVSWNDSIAFCEWLSKKENATYRLPTEAEWEYACRAGTKSAYCSGVSPNSIYAYGNVADATVYAEHPQDVERQRVVGLKPEDADGHVYTAPVGSLKPNDWGLYDVHGNLWEWCSDKYSDRIYKDMLEIARKRGSRNNPEPIVDPTGPKDTPQHKHGNWRSLRGGSWYVAPLQCRCSVRAFAEAEDAWCYVGFRVVRE